MLTKTYKASLAIFMIALIINLTSYSAIAAGTSLKVKKAAGIDGFDKLLRQADTIQIEVEASIDSKDIVPEQLRFIGPETITTGDFFTSCNEADPINKIFLCSYTSASLDLKNYPGIIDTTVVLYHDTNMPGPSQDIEFKVDKAKPRATINAPSKLGGNKDLTISYTAKDPATASSSCSGITKIEFFLNDNASLFDTLELDGKKCDVSGTLTKPAADFSGLDGEFKVLIKATDLLGFESDISSDTFIVDQLPPQADLSTFKILKDNIPLEFISPNGINGVSISLGINADDLDANSVIADFSGLSTKKSLKGLKASCGSSANSITTCTWSNIDIFTAQPGNVSISFSDTEGNLDTVSFIPALAVDTDAPEVLSLSTGMTSKTNMPLLGKSNNTISININEVTSGLDASQVFLDLGQIGNSNNIKADECSPGWICTWRNIAASSNGVKTISLNPDTRDKAGNRLKEIKPFSVYVDAKPPEKKAISITAIGGVLPAYEDYIKSQDSLAISINLTEENAITSAEADLSRFISGNSTITGSCQEIRANFYTCSWQTPPIDKPGFLQQGIRFTITDSANNKLSFTQSITVNELSNAVPDYFSNTVTCSPRMIDRQITKMINQRIYCHVKLQGNAIPIKTELLGCKGQEIKSMGENTTIQVDSSTYIQNVEIMNNEVESVDPYLKITLKPMDMNIDSLPLTCGLGIIVKSGNKIMSRPEIENVTLDIKLYNMPLGEYSSEVRNLIDHERDVADNTLWKVIGTLNKIFSYAEKICNYYYALNGLYQTFIQIGAILGVIANGASTTPYGSVIDNVRRLQQQGTSYFGDGVKQIFKPMNQFCKFISCRLYFDEKWTDKKKKDKPDATPKDPDKKGIGMKLGESQRKNLAFFGGLGGSQILRGGSSAKDRQGNPMQLPGELDPMNYMNPKESLILSIAMFCIPGVIYNLNKLRNIQCMYVDCMEMSAQSNIPIKACAEQKEYSTCKYIYGEFFKIFGLIAVFDYLIGIVKNAISDPLAIVDVTTQLYCDPVIAKPYSGLPSALCLIKDMISLIFDVVSDFKGIIKQSGDWSVPKDYCSQLEKREKNAQADSSANASSDTGGTSNSPPSSRTPQTPASSAPPAGQVAPPPYQRTPQNS